LKRASTIAAIALAALLGAILPVAALVYISWSRAQVAETDRLERTAERPFNVPTAPTRPACWRCASSTRRNCPAARPSTSS